MSVSAEGSKILVLPECANLLPSLTASSNVGAPQNMKVPGRQKARQKICSQMQQQTSTEREKDSMSDQSEQESALEAFMDALKGLFPLRSAGEWGSTA